MRVAVIVMADPSLISLIVECHNDIFMQVFLACDAFRGICRFMEAELPGVVRRFRLTTGKQVFTSRSVDFKFQ